MMTLSTKYVKDADDHFVAWRTGIKRCGLIHVLHVAGEDARAIAELVAIRYLLLEKEVFSRKLLSGTGIKLEVSTELIRKLSKGTSSKRHLLDFAKFLHTRLDGVTVESLRDESFASFSLDLASAEVIDANVDDRSDVFITPAMGDIRVTKHAISQYKERLHSGDPNNPVLSLMTRLRHPELKKQTIPDRVALHKLKKYGDLKNTEIWGHDNSQMHYVVIRDPASTIGTVVTVYRRHQDYC